MDDYQRQHLESILRDYPKLDKYMAMKLDELSYPYQGHSHVLSKLAPGTLLFNDCIVTDRCLMQLEINKRCIDFCLKQSDEITRDIIEQLYFRRANNLNLEGIGMMLNISKSSVSRRRAAFLSFLEQELGYY